MTQSFHTFLLALFIFFYITVSLAIYHVERTYRQSRSRRGTLARLNSLMGFMGFAVVLEHWFKASSIVQLNEPEEKEHVNTLPSSLTQSCAKIVPSSFVHFFANDCSNKIIHKFHLYCSAYFVKKRIANVLTEKKNFMKYWWDLDFHVNSLMLKRIMEQKLANLMLESHRRNTPINRTLMFSSFVVFGALWLIKAWIKGLPTVSCLTR